VTNLLTLPSHYILKSWSRNAKSGVILDERTTDLSHDALDSLSIRYNNLCHEALKYVDEGVNIRWVPLYNNLWHTRLFINYKLWWKKISIEIWISDECTNCQHLSTWDSWSQELYLYGSWSSMASIWVVCQIPAKRFL